MEFKHGLYKHFKGGLYRTILTALDSETKQPMVLYLNLSTGQFWLRPPEMFTEMVTWPDDISRARFIFIEEDDSPTSATD